MADELQFARETGLTITASVYGADGTLISGSIACGEIGTTGLYIGDMPTASAGSYTVIFADSTEGFVGAGKIEWDGSAEITVRTLDTNVGALNNFNPATQSVTVGAMDNNVITSSTIANNALTNSAFTTGYYNSISSGVLDATVESGYSMAESMRLQNAVLLGKVSGANTTTNTFRDIADTKDRVTATVDTNGNRTAITLDET